MSRRLTAAQWQAVIAEHAQSPLSVTAFCQRKGLSLSSFHRWRRKLRKQITPPASGFIEVSAPASPEPPRSAWCLELDLPGGGHLRLRFEP